MTVQKKWMTFLLILCILVTAMSTAFLLLPDTDLDALREGIPVYTDSELERLIEDYGG